MNKSICMATYNGSKYITKQLDSIISQLSADDEIIIVDDKSTDNTLEIIGNYKDSRIKIYENEKNLRHVRTFERAISLSKNELIFLCDQDDIWSNNRLNIFEESFKQNPNVVLITSNFDCINDFDEPIENKLCKISTHDSFLYNKNIMSIFLGRIGYFGCAMAFRKELVSTILPIPDNVEAHDLWIGMVANYLKCNFHIADKTLNHRIHNSNASNLKRRFNEKIKARFDFFKLYLEIVRRVKIQKQINGK